MKACAITMFLLQKSKIEISTCYISACFALLAGSSAVVFLRCVAILSCTLACAKLCETVRRLAFFLCAAKLATKKSQVVRFVVVFVFFVSLCVRCGSSGRRLPRKTLPNRGTLQQSHLVESNQVSIHDAIFKMDFAKDLEFWDMPHRKSSETINLSAKTSMITYHHDWSTNPP